MKAIVLLVSMICLFIFSSAQSNLVLNPGLENYVTCPGFGQFSNTYINDWDKPTWGSTDYYNYNCAGIIPTQQVPHTGNAYAGIICYNYGTEYREYMTGTLSSPLVAGATYYCEFYVSLNDGYIQAIKEIGAYFSASPPGPYSNALHVPATPQVVNTTILLDDTSSWMRVSGYFLATGGEQYITIGNFYNDTNTTILQVGNVGSFGAYYFVDDAWVSLSEGLGVGIMDDEGISVYPNPMVDKCKIHNAEFTIGTAVKFEIFNMIGDKVMAVQYKFKNQEHGISLDVSLLPSGIYILEINDGEKIFRKKVVKE